MKLGHAFEIAPDVEGIFPTIEKDIFAGIKRADDGDKGLGYDAGFAPGKYADDVATFVVEEMVKRRKY